MLSWCMIQDLLKRGSIQPLLDLYAGETVRMLTLKFYRSMFDSLRISH